MTDTQYLHTEAFTARAASRLSPREAALVAGVRLSTYKAWENGSEQAPPEAIAAIRAAAKAPAPQPSGGSSFRFIDLFAGIGGLRRAFESSGGECVFTCEWNKNALETYIANSGDSHPIAADMTKVPAGKVPDHDFLVAGFPCQPFSLAGVSKKNSLGRPHGFADKTQGTLFFDVARVLDEKRPAGFLLENVKNLVSHDKGRTFEVIIDTLEELGYSVSWEILDASAWVPQKRQRIAIVGFREGGAFDFSTVQRPQNGSGAPTLGDILHVEGEPGSEDCPYAPNGVPDDRYTLSDNLWRYLQNYAAKHASLGNGFGYGLVGPEDVARTLSARYGKDGSEVLVRQEGRNPRRLTPRECARLMGFETRGGPKMAIPVSDAQAYKQFGNSVVVPAFAAVAQAMARKLELDREMNASLKAA